MVKVSVVRRGEAEKGGVAVLAILAVFALLLLSLNPPETDLRQRAGKDGWMPVGFERTNLGLLSIVKVNGFTGQKTTYIGFAGMIF